MAVKTIQIADKPTLDATKALLEDSEVGLAAIKQAASSGAVSGSAGGLQIEKYVDEQVSGDIAVSTLPYNFNYGAAVVFNNEIHILGGTYNKTAHYKYNGSSWEEVSTLPYNFNYGAAVVFNNEIHILGGSGDQTKHYKYNGSSWEEVSTLPYRFVSSAAVVFNNEIHILGGSYDTGTYTKHYKYNGSSWGEVSTLPYNFYGGSAVVRNSLIYIIGSNYSDSRTKCYYYNSSTSRWYNTYDTLPYEFCWGSAVVLNNRIHILGGETSGHTRDHYIYGSSWKKASPLSSNPTSNSACVLNGEIYYTNGSKLYIAKNGNRHIATMLPKGAHIMLSDNEDINYVKNAEKVSSNIAEVTENGYVEVLATLPEIDDIKGYLTFY